MHIVILKYYFMSIRFAVRRAGADQPLYGGWVPADLPLPEGQGITPDPSETSRTPPSSIMSDNDEDGDGVSSLLEVPPTEYDVFLTELNTKGYALVKVFPNNPETVVQLDESLNSIYGTGDISKDLVNVFEFIDEEDSDAESDEDYDMGETPEVDKVETLSAEEERRHEMPIIHRPLHMYDEEENLVKFMKGKNKGKYKFYPETYRDVIYSRDQLVFHSEHPNGIPQRRLENLKAMLRDGNMLERLRTFEEHSNRATQIMNSLLHDLFKFDRTTRWVEYGILGCRTRGCPRQTPHTDYSKVRIAKYFPHKKAQEKPLVMIYSFRPGTRIYIRDPCTDVETRPDPTAKNKDGTDMYNKYGEKVVHIPEGHAFFFAGDVAHAGAEYYGSHIRMHAYIGIKRKDGRDIFFNGSSTHPLNCLTKEELKEIDTNIEIHESTLLNATPQIHRETRRLTSASALLRNLKI